MDENEVMQNVFRDAFDIKRIIAALEIETGFKLDPENTLIIFDEIQEIPRVLKSLKYFYENAPVEIVTRIKMLWNSIPTQLAKENKKFIYGLVREGARARQ